MIAWMQEARVNAYERAFRLAMEFWARGEPVPERHTRLSRRMKRRHPSAIVEADRRAAEDVCLRVEMARERS